MKALTISPPHLRMIGLLQLRIWTSKYFLLHHWGLGRVQLYLSLPSDQPRLLHVEPVYHSRLVGWFADEGHACHCGLLGIWPHPLSCSEKKKVFLNTQPNQALRLNPLVYPLFTQVLTLMQMYEEKRVWMGLTDKWQKLNNWKVTDRREFSKHFWSDLRTTDKKLRLLLFVWDLLK